MNKELSAMYKQLAAHDDEILAGGPDNTSAAATGTRHLAVAELNLACWHAPPAAAKAPTRHTLLTEWQTETVQLQQPSNGHLALTTPT